MSNSNKDPKRYEFTSKTDLIEFLNLIIELSVKHMWRYKVYYEELKKLTFDYIGRISNTDIKLITEDNWFDFLENVTGDSKLCKNDLAIDYLEYKSIEDRICNVKNQLLNLLGDRTSKGGVSYWRFRQEYDKMLKNNVVVSLPKLQEWSQELREKINSFHDVRNYEHHMTDAKFIEWRDYRKKQGIDYKWPTEVIMIDRPEKLSIFILFELFRACKEMKESSQKIIQQMKRDYSMLYGESMKIQYEYSNTDDLSMFPISMNGIDRHLGRRK